MSAKIGFFLQKIVIRYRLFLKPLHLCLQPCHAFLALLQLLQVAVGQYVVRQVGGGDVVGIHLLGTSFGLGVCGLHGFLRPLDGGVYVVLHLIAQGDPETVRSNPDVIEAYLGTDEGDEDF